MTGMESKYVLELRTTTWVFWGYGPRGDNLSMEYIEPAIVVLDKEGLGIELEFELPTSPTSGRTAVEYERRKGIAWRYTDGRGGGTVWVFAKNKKAALAAAKAYVDRTPYYSPLRQVTTVKET